MDRVGEWNTSRLDRMHDVMSGYVEREELPGLVTLVSRRGEVHAGAIGNMDFSSNKPMQRDTIFRIASMTKPITAVAAMILVEECRLRLDEPLDQFLPELTDRQVLRSIESELSDTVPAQRSITLRDLLTLRMGIGAVMAPPGSYPIQQAMSEAGLAPGVNPPPHTPDEWMKRLGSLPLIYQPGDKWLYHTGSDVLGVLIERASGQPFDRFLKERIFQPLGMKDTDFQVPPEKLERLATSYKRSLDGKLVVYEEPKSSLWARTPKFQSGGGGLVSTVDDYLAFCQMLLNQGRFQGEGERILSRASVELMTTDHLTATQRAENAGFFEGHSSWGFGVGISIKRQELFGSPGRFGWDGGAGTSGYTDPSENMIGIILTQRLFDSPKPINIFQDFWNSTYQAVGD